MQWHSIHVHYHDPDLDSMLVEAIGPALRELSGVATAMYFVRHWRRGPHARINVRAPEPIFHGTVVPTVRRQAEQFFAQRPSDGSLTPERLLPLHRRLAEREKDPGPLLPWEPDHAVRVAPYESRADVLGSVAASELLAGFLSDTNEVSLEVIDRCRRSRRLLQVAFDLMVGVAHAFSGRGIRVGFVSYRSHAEGMLHTEPGGRQLREAWDGHYRQHWRQLAGRVRTVVDTMDRGLDSHSILNRWIEPLRVIQDRGRELLRAGTITMEHSLPEPDPSGSASHLPQLSDFHRRLVENRAFMTVVLPSLWFAVFRLVLNYHYVQLTRAGTTPIDRAFLCHLVANAVEDCYDVSALDHVSSPGLGSPSYLDLSI